MNVPNLRSGPRLRATLTSGTLRTYNTHLNWLETTWHNYQLDQISKADLDYRAHTVQTASCAKPRARNGTSAQEQFISTARCLYRYAEDNKWLHPTRNPARHLEIPTRPPSHRQAIPSPQLTEICHITALTGNDPELDTLLLSYTSKPPAAAAAPFAYALATSTHTNA